jgi:hypothetical protein
VANRWKTKIPVMIPIASFNATNSVLWFRMGASHEVMVAFLVPVACK